MPKPRMNWKSPSISRVVDGVMVLSSTNPTAATAQLAMGIHL